MDLPFTPGASTVISPHADQTTEGSPELLSPTECSQQSVGAGEERGSEGGADRKQKKKKKRRPMDEVYDLLDPETQEEMKALADSHGDLEWEYGDGGRFGGRVKKGKSRKRIPEEWSALQEVVPPNPVSLPPVTLLPEPTDALSKEGHMADLGEPPISPWLSPENSPPSVPPCLTQDPSSLVDTPATAPPPTMSAEAPPSLSSLFAGPLPRSRSPDSPDKSPPPSHEPENEAVRDPQKDAPIAPLAPLSRESGPASPQPPPPP